MAEKGTTTKTTTTDATTAPRRGRKPGSASEPSLNWDEPKIASLIRTLRAGVTSLSALVETLSKDPEFREIKGALTESRVRAKYAQLRKIAADGGEPDVVPPLSRSRSGLDLAKLKALAGIG